MQQNILSKDHGQMKLSNKDDVVESAVIIEGDVAITDLLSKDDSNNSIKEAKAKQNSTPCEFKSPARNKLNKTKDKQKDMIEVKSTYNEQQNIADDALIDITRSHHCRQNEDVQFTTKTLNHLVSNQPKEEVKLSWTESCRATQGGGDNQLKQDNDFLDKHAAEVFNDLKSTKDAPDGRRGRKRKRKSKGRGIHRKWAEPKQEDRDWYQKQTYTLFAPKWQYEQLYNDRPYLKGDMKREVPEERYRLCFVPTDE